MALAIRRLTVLDHRACEICGREEFRRRNGRRLNVRDERYPAKRDRSKRHRFVGKIWTPCKRQSLRQQADEILPLATQGHQHRDRTRTANWSHANRSNPSRRADLFASRTRSTDRNRGGARLAFTAGTMLLFAARPATVRRPGGIGQRFAGRGFADKVRWLDAIGLGPSQPFSHRETAARTPTLIGILAATGAIHARKWLAEIFFRGAVHRSGKCGQRQSAGDRKLVDDQQRSNETTPFASSRREAT